MFMHFSILNIVFLHVSKFLQKWFSFYNFFHDAIYLNKFFWKGQKMQSYTEQHLSVIPSNPPCPIPIGNPYSEWGMQPFYSL
jgi:hypothetical protein